ncbi:hypothetical protein JCM9140_4846 [Halalkalibacter wakoensis JCM 9140]|uniref:Type IV pilus biogenesis protein PilO n=1 Tax=Halalkalibacter wakoensis JCM 9140 TaxID=1236970 RepID=W4Q9F0_9BACI|nr:hypothetical protein [Halalkalibacter wakoensis]GAE28597.1 hypothetical protein JCM9140_4846 [Halalkalibacter wakoensis JCM 9140]
MVELQPKVKRLLISFLVALTLAIPFLLYFMFIKPLQDDLARVQDRLETEEQLLSIVERNIAELENQVTNLSSADLQKKVPVAPLVDQFLLDLERSEILSESLILNYQFSSSTFSGLGIESARGSLEEELENGIVIREQSAEAEPESDTFEIEEGIEKVTAQMTVISPSYEEMKSFLEEIESLTRVTTINRLSFSGNQEVRLLDQTVDDLQYVVEVSTYYLPQLQELLDEVPTQSYPRPGNKANPLYYGVKSEE